MTQFNSKLISQAKKTKGYLIKKSNGVFSSWKKRYFIVINDSLQYFQDQTLSNIKKSIKFTQMIHIKPIQKLDFEIKTKKKTYLLRTANQSQQDLWVASLNIIRQKCLKQSFASDTKDNKKQLNLKKSSISTQQRLKLSNSFADDNIKKEFNNQKINYLFKQKQLNRLFIIFELDKLSLISKQQKVLKRILFFQDKDHGIYFALCSKSIYSIIDDQLLKEDLIYPYQLNVLYFVPITIYKFGADKKDKHKSISLKMTQICKLNQLLECSLINKTLIKLQIHCQKPLQIQFKHLNQSNIINLSECIKKAMKVGKQYWNPKGKLLKNIDIFLQTYYQNSQNEAIFNKLVEQQFQKALQINRNFTNILEQKQISIFFNQFDSLISNLKNFNDACEIKDPPLIQIRQNFVKIYHKFVYNLLNKCWIRIFKKISNDQLILYTNKVNIYYQIINSFFSDNRLKLGCKTLLKIVLDNFMNSIIQLVQNYTKVQQESLRILKKSEFQNQDNQVVNKQIFFNTFCTNFISIFVVQFKQLSQLVKNDQLISIGWTSMKLIFKKIFQKLLLLSQQCKQRASLISICNTLNFIKNKKIPQIFSQLQKTSFFSLKKQKQQFIKQINYEIFQINIFCVKKLFVITFSTIDRDLLKNQIKNIDFQRICSIVIEQITKLDYLFPEVRIAMYESAFQQVCYFFYICVVKFDNKTLNKDDCISMITQKMTVIKQEFTGKVDKQKIMFLLKDLNLLKVFITSPINLIKDITRDLKATFGSNFSQLNLKNLISLRTNILKQKQFLFEQCRQQMKNSYNSNQQMQSIQRESFFNSSYRRDRKSTLTQSLQSYCIDKYEKSKNRIQQNFNFGFQKIIKEGYIYRKRAIKNINTTFTKYFYRLIKGKLYQYDSQETQDYLNSYQLNQLKKCYIQPQKNDCIHLEFDKDIMKLKLSNYQQATQWIQRILEAVEQNKPSFCESKENQLEQGVLFEDFSKKKTLETKETQQMSSPASKNSRRNNNQKPSVSPNIAQSKKTPHKANNNKGNESKSKQKYDHKFNKKSPKKLEKQQKNKRSQNRCGTSCKFL